jgi:hypothetical protein
MRAQLGCRSWNFDEAQVSLTKPRSHYWRVAWHLASRRSQANPTLKAEKAELGVRYHAIVFQYWALVSSPFNAIETMTRAPNPA